MTANKVGLATGVANASEGAPGPTTSAEIPPSTEPLCEEGYTLVKRSIWTGGRGTGGRLTRHIDACEQCQNGSYAVAQERYDADDHIA